MTYILLIRLTEQGVNALHQSPERADAFIGIAEKAGAHVKGMYWTACEYDGVLLLDTSDEETAAALALYLTRLGNVRVTSMRAYQRAEMETILEKMPR